MTGTSVINQQSESITDFEKKESASKAFSELSSSVYAALETYSNVHRGSGQFSLVTTHLYEKAREIVLGYLNLDKLNYTVVFCTPARADYFITHLDKNAYRIITSRELGLPVAVAALAIRKEALPKGTPFQTGGGTTILISRNWVDWAGAPDKFEAGTPAIINVVAFAKALLLVNKYGIGIFSAKAGQETVSELLYQDEFDAYKGKDLYKRLQGSVIGNNIKVPTISGLQTFINLDSSASTSSLKPVWETYNKCLQQPEVFLEQLTREVKAICAAFLQAPQEQYDILFTSNSTESVNILAENIDLRGNEDIEPVIVNSVMEHSSNELPWRFMKGTTLIRCDVDEYGLFDLKELETLLKEYNQESKFGKKRIKLIALTSASNVLGVCNDIREISALAKKFNVRLMIDAAQLVAHRGINLTDSGIDYMVFSAHKIYAPFGTGVIISRKGLLDLTSNKLKGVILSGEENASGIAALGKSVLLLQRIGMDVIEEEERALCFKALSGMLLIPRMKIFGIKDPDSKEFKFKIGVIPFSFSNIYGDKIAAQLAFYGGIGIRFGCHCAHIIVKRLAGLKPFLEPVQRMIVRLFPKLKLPGVARASIGLGTTESDIDRFLETLKLITSKDKTLKAGIPAIKKEIDSFIKEREQKVYYN